MIEIVPNTKCTKAGLPIIALLVINSFNFIDGVNGLCRAIGLLANVVLEELAMMTGEIEYALVAFSTVGATLGFLAYNLIHGKIFLRDTGAMIIGFGTAVGGLSMLGLVISILTGFSGYCW